MSNKWQIKCDSPGYSRLLVDLNKVLAVSSLLNYWHFCQKTTLIFFAQLPECCIWTNIFDKCVDVDAVKIMCIIYCAPFCKQGYHTSKGAWCSIGHKTSNAEQKITICHRSTLQRNKN